MNRNVLDASGYALAENYIRMFEACGVEVSHMDPLDIWLQGSLIDSHTTIEARRQELKLFRDDFPNAVLPTVEEAFASLSEAERQRMGETIVLRFRG